LKSKNKHEGVIGGLLRAIANAASTDHRYCPLWFCKARVGLDEFPSHLLEHRGEELGAAASELTEARYVVSKSGCEHDEGETRSLSQPCSCKVTSIELSCPVCSSRHARRQELKTHIEEYHVWAGEDTSAFRKRILALVGMEATQVLGTKVWSDVGCRLRMEEDKE
jgi:hypothetical protein